ncbi:DUF1573 domain-containing protein [uncultured Draconibacterium sp.]|uniref:DUF1573 domain-containing protein n=1 Tax=uncultured Draconibacterium sp. TaxID=1573823 RepID=UPI003216628B
MRNILITFSFLLLFACGQKAGKETGNTDFTSEKTSIKFNEKMHDFGQLKAGEIVLYTFEFTNTGNADYRIENIRTDCGCVSTNFSKTPVKPGETGVIEVEFDTSGLVGKEYKSIEIDGNSTELKHLAIFAEVKNEILDIKY